MRVDLRRDRGLWRLERVQAAAARAGERAPPRNRGAGRWEAGVGAPATRYPVRASGPTVRARRPGVGTRSRRTGVTESSPPTRVPSLEPCRHLLTTELLRRPCAGARFCSARDRPNAVEGGLLAHDSRARAACDCRVQSARRCAASKIGVGSTALSWVGRGDGGCRLCLHITGRRDRCANFLLHGNTREFSFWPYKSAELRVSPILDAW